MYDFPEGTGVGPLKPDGERCRRTVAVEEFVKTMVLG